MLPSEACRARVSAGTRRGARVETKSAAARWRRFNGCFPRKISKIYSLARRRDDGAASATAWRPSRVTQANLLSAGNPPCRVRGSSPGYKGVAVAVRNQAEIARITGKSPVIARISEANHTTRITSESPTNHRKSEVIIQIILVIHESDFRDSCDSGDSPPPSVCGFQDALTRAPPL